MKIDELPESIILKDGKFKTCLKNIIETIKVKIWGSDTLLKHYTKHGIDHSERIAQYLGKLLEDFSNLLNEQERFVLLAAILLHDIGMQLPKYASLPYKSEYSMKELEIIRKNHHVASYDAIIDSIKTNAKLRLGLDLCKKYTKFIALLCKYHRELNLSDLQDTSIAGNSLRLLLLGALLRLGDELDADHQRVNMEVLNLKDIPTESKFYWWSHHYVQSLSIIHGHIKLFYWFPEEYKNNDIVKVFKNKRKESLSEQYLEVYDIFESYGARLYRDIEMGDTIYLSDGSLQPIPSDLLEHVKTTITQPGSNYKKLSDTPGVAWEIGGVLYSDNEKVVEALAKISQLMNEYKYSKAVKIIEETSLLKMSPTDSMVFSGIAGNCYLLLSEFEKAKSYYNKQLELSKKKDLRAIYQPNIIDAQSAASTGNIGIVYQIQGNPEQALQYQQQALDIARTISDKEREANSLCNLGIVYGAQGDLKKAIEHFKSALTIHREISSKKGEASYLGNMGIVYRIQGDLKKAIEHFQQALKIYREIGNKQWEASALDEMGIVFRIKGDLEKALELHQQALKINRKIGNKVEEASALNEMGIVYRIQGYPKKALELHQQALKINRKIGNKVEEARALENMGDVYHTQSKLKKALNNLKKSLKIFKDIGASANIEKIIKKIKIIEEEIKK